MTLFNTTQFRIAPSGGGPLAAEWDDKPHRLVYDLCKEVERLQSGQERLLHLLKKMIAANPAFRTMHIGAENSEARRRQVEQIAAEDEALALIKELET